MADGICDWGDTPHARNVIITTLRPPSTIELCDDHYAPGLIPLLAANLGVDVGKLYAAIERFVAKAAKDADKEALAEAAVSRDPENGERLYTPDDAEAMLEDPDQVDREETGLFHGSGEEAL